MHMRHGLLFVARRVLASSASPSAQQTAAAGAGSPTPAPAAPRSRPVSTANFVDFGVRGTHLQTTRIRRAFSAIATCATAATLDVPACREDDASALVQRRRPIMSAIAISATRRRTTISAR